MTVAPALAAGGDPAGSGAGESQLRSRLRALRDDATRKEIADGVLGLLDAGRLRRADGLADLVDRASERAGPGGRRPGHRDAATAARPAAGAGPATWLDGDSAGLDLNALRDAGRRHPGRLLVRRRRDVGPGLVAADELDVDLERLALVPNPGPDWPEVVAVLLDGVDLVVVAAPTATAPAPARRLPARARQRGSVLVGVGDWPRAELTIETDHGVWHGLEAGRGRLRCRSLTVTVWGRGAAGRARQAHMWLPALTSPLPMITGQAVVEPRYDRDRSGGRGGGRCMRWQ